MPRSTKRPHTTPKPATDLLAVWIGLLFWAAVFWLGGMFALTLDTRLGFFSFAPLWLQALGLVLAVFGVILILLSTHLITRSPDHPHLGGLSQELVTTGVYGLMRHPMYLGFITLAFGYGLLLNSPSFTSIFAPGLALILSVKANREDWRLSRRHGPLHHVYRRNVPGFVPRLWRQR